MTALPSAQVEQELARLKMQMLLTIRIRVRVKNRVRAARRIQRAYRRPGPADPAQERTRGGAPATPDRKAARATVPVAKAGGAAILPRPAPFASERQLSRSDRA